MNLVLYTKNDELKEFFKKALPPSLQKEYFNQEAALKDFLKKLTIPTQVILDKDTFTFSLKSFLQQNKFHHVICVSHVLNFHESLELIHLGSIVITWHELTYLDWWWNRSMISFQKRKLEELNHHAVIFIPHTQVLKIRHFFESSIWRLFYQAKPRILTLDGSDHSGKYLDLCLIFFKTMQRHNTQEALAIAVKNFSAISPMGFRELLKIYKQYEPFFQNLKLFIYFDANHSNFDRAFDNCSTHLNSKIFRLDCKKIERMNQKLLATEQTEELYQHISQFLLIEEAALSWKSLV
ncbi:hypothetical protein EBR43_09380 [bacterium]|nr:hypothetical protein [bacterium]NBX72600.1 hypothetical protein [bacterium]